MALKANVREAVVSLYAAKQRSFLALIGIVIGIGSVIVLLSVGTIANLRHAPAPDLGGARSHRVQPGARLRQKSPPEARRRRG